MNLAAFTVPATTGKVTPPEIVRALAGVSVTVPGIVGLTATFPKLMSSDLEMAIGVMIVADAVAVAVTCALTVIEAIEKIATSDKRMVIFFILI